MTSFRQHLGLIRSRFLYYRNPLQTRKMVRFYRQFIGEGDLCFDVGAHLGNRTNAWRKLGANIIALEPQPQCMDFLKGKFGNDPKVVLLPHAVSDKAGKTTLHISSLTPTISTLADEKWRKVMADSSSFKVEWDQNIEVEVVTLDQLIEKYGLPTFCKIDVEGLEYEVLKGLTQPIPGISLEYLSDTASLEAVRCIDQLEKIGQYEYNWSYAESLDMESDKWISSGDMRSYFQSMTADHRSGDFYARIKS